MDGATRKADELRQQISRAEKELEGLRRQLRDLETDPGTTPTTTTTTTTTTTAAEATTASASPQGPSKGTTAASSPSPPPPPPDVKPWSWPLSEEEYERYARQLILPGFGTPAQLRLRGSSVLIVGAGGLGCPAALYLAGAGVGRLGIVDGDTVEVSNLHRQVGHSSLAAAAAAAAGKAVRKAESLAARCRALNPLVRYDSHAEHLGAANAARVVAPYDVVLDCTDRPASRYLVSDACVLLGKPLVSASALRTDGQLIVLNSPPSRNRRGGDGGGDGGDGGGEGEGDREGGPCYRCVFPRPPPASSVLSCGEGGILGPVVGVMGVLQALEAIKLIIASASPPQPQPQPPTSPSLLLFSAHSTPPTFRTVRMRGRRPDCFACSPRSTLTLEELGSGSLDYAQFCGVSAPVGVLRPEERVSPTEYDRVRRAAGVGVVAAAASPEQEGQQQQQRERHLLLDVREKEHYNVASIPGSVNVPFSKFQAQNNSYNKPVGDPAGGEGEPARRPDWMPESLAPDAPIYVVCRVGNDSQLVTRKLKEMGLDRDGARFIGDIKGGMRAWKQEVDHTIPFT